MASENCLHYSSYKLNPWSVNIMSLWDFISIWVSPPPLIFVHFYFVDQIFSSRKNIYLIYGPFMASKNCLYYSPFKWNPWSVNIMSLCDFISIWVSPPPPHFRAFSIFGRIIFQAEKKSIGDIVHIWLLKTV